MTDFVPDDSDPLFGPAVAVPSVAATVSAPAAPNPLFDPSPVDYVAPKPPVAAEPRLDPGFDAVPARPPVPAPVPASAPPPVATVTVPAERSEPRGELAELPKAPSEAHRRVAEKNGWTFVDLDDPEFSVSTEARLALPGPIARRYNVVPTELTGPRLTIATSSPNDPDLMANLRENVKGLTLRLAYANPTAINRWIGTVYSATDEAADLATGMARKGGRKGNNRDSKDLGRVTGTDDSETTKVLRLIIEAAAREGASDIHIEATAEALQVRYRIDGDLHLISTYPKALAKPLLMKIKVDAKMHTDNWMIPDSGMMQFVSDDGAVLNLRVETKPAYWGASAVMRIQPTSLLRLAQIGFSTPNEKRFRHVLSQDYGLILAVGPTNSGKSSLMYAGLMELMGESTKIISVENPVEYAFPSGIEQIAVNEAQGMGWAEAARSIVRSDPDVVMIGEIRDAATAEAAIQASMTGQLVLSTLHTNTAVGVVHRMRELGVERDLLGESLLCAVSQRLVKRLCLKCRIPRPFHESEATANGFNLSSGVPDHIYDARPDGCEECRNGYRGRLPLQEVLIPSAEMLDAIAEDQPQATLREMATRSGMTSLRDDGWLKVRQGLTSLGEVSAKTRRGLA